MSRFLIQSIACLIAIGNLAVPQAAISADGDPVAIVRPSDNMLRIENVWGLEVQIQASESNVGRFQVRVTDSVKPVVVSQDNLLDHVLSREPNQMQATFRRQPDGATDLNAPSGSIHLDTVVGDGDEALAIVVRTDGVTVLVANSISGIDWDSKTSPDAVVLISPPDTVDLAKSCEWLKSVSPRTLVLGANTNAKTIQKWVQQCGATQKTPFAGGNTLALSQTGESDGPMRVIALGDQPWKMPSEIDKLFAAMESSCERSQEVFRPLSAKQLNFKPSNGTHTPRWNVEHMMGRQLVFFSQIYNAQDPSIPVMNLNPKQMPPDYKAAHPDWDGAEEARQMERVSNFTRRFAYLLDGVDLDTRAPGSRWTLRGLLQQMERHYDEHTANTQKKFELPEN